jgi:thioesterase domain-containing protein
MDDLEAMARRYRREARRVQPSGPLHLGGWSLGGVVAFEMARQEVAEQGEEAVGPLLLIDSWLMDAADSAAGSSKSVESGESGASGENVLLARFTRHLELPAEAVEAVGAVVRGERPEASVADRLPEGLDLPTLFRVFRAHGHALAEYSRRVASMEPYPGVVHLFEATERPATVRGSAAALWRPRVATGQLLVETIPGNHFTLLRGESARTLARRVRRMQQGVESV